MTRSLYTKIQCPTPVGHQLFPSNRKLSTIFFCICKYSLNKNCTFLRGTLPYIIWWFKIKWSEWRSTLKTSRARHFYQLIVQHWIVGLCGVLLMAVPRFMKTVTWFKRWKGEPQQHGEFRSILFSFTGKKLYRNRHSLCDFGNCCYL
jgi:hypothetical protein